MGEVPSKIPVKLKSAAPGYWHSLTNVGAVYLSNYYKQKFKVMHWNAKGYITRRRNCNTSFMRETSMSAAFRKHTFNRVGIMKGGILTLVNASPMLPRQKHTWMDSEFFASDRTISV